ncbi:MAG: hypothetical protein GF350_13660 [Chitinivibrionales bacterium]|nr:hypothetical protein [Chitinivibrionales bacterium]
MQAAGEKASTKQNVKNAQLDAATNRNTLPYEEIRNEYTIRLTECRMEGSKACFNFLVTNNRNQQRTVSFNRHKIQLIDAGGNVYNSSDVTFGSSRGAPGGAAFVQQTLLSPE